MEVPRNAPLHQCIKPKVFLSLGELQVSVTIKDKKCASSDAHHIFILTSLFCPCKKVDGFWRVTVDYHKINQSVTSIAACVPDAISFSEQINMDSAIYYASIT